MEPPEPSESIESLQAALAALTQREALYRSVIESSLDGFVKTDLHGCLLEVNDAMVRLSRYGRDELLQMRILDLEANENLLEFSQHAERVIRLGGDLFETRFRRKDGSIWQVEANVTYSATRGGCFFAFLRDINERKRDEQIRSFRAQLAEVANHGSIEDLLRKTIDSAELWTGSNIGFFHFVAADQQTLSLQAWSSNTLQNQCSAAAMEPHCSVDGAGIWAEAVRKRQPVIVNDYPASASKSLPAGHPPITRLASIPVPGPDGRIIAVLGVGNKPQAYDGEDIFLLTSLGMQAMELVAGRNNTDRLNLTQCVFDATQDCIMITDARGDIIAANRAFTRVTGYTEPEVLGRNPRLLKSGRHARPFYVRMFDQVLRRGFWQGEVINRRKNGEEYTQWLTINVVRDPHGDVVNFVGVSSDLTEKHAAEAKAQYLTHHDALTGLPNRAHFEMRLAQAVARSQRRHQNLALLQIDIDRFKNINESLGHPVGDELLKEVARRLQARLRKEDTLARLGSDEFAILIDELPRLDSAAIVAQLVIDAINEPFLLGEHEVFVGASVGVSLCPNDAVDAVGLLRNVDSAVALAKAQGRGIYRFYTEGLTETARVRMELNGKLRHALKQDEFLIHYQPQVSLESDRMIGVEALVRWQRDGRLVSPAVFIPVAEETGLIEAIGAWVLRQSCFEVKRWIDAGGAPLTLAVNVSARQFHPEKLPALVADVLRDTGFPPEWLELEITESAIMEHADDSIAILDSLKALGVKLAIDDFGTGYSSLAYLKRFRVDKLKIDQSFVRDIPDDTNDMEIASTIIAMARHMHLKVLAEGVETEPQRNFLQAQGCDYFQGYLFSKPLPAADCQDLHVKTA